MTGARKSKIYFFFEEAATLPERNKLKSFIERLFKVEKQDLSSLNYIFTTDERLLEINRQYLKHDYYTDIITFDISAPTDPTCGEVYISVPRVRENAATHQESFKKELHRVIFHGALHLCGYKDGSGQDKAKMREREDYYLKQYFASFT